MAGFGVDRGGGSSSGDPNSPITESLIDAKGDLIVGTADNTADRLAVGANGLVLTADSAQTKGVKWGTPQPAADFVPLTTSLYGLGTSLLKWLDLWLAGDANIGGDLLVGKATYLQGDISPTQLTGNVDDYAPTSLADSSVLRLSSDASRNITGLTGGADGRILTVHNVGAFPIVFVYESGSSTAANRFAFPCQLGGGQSLMMQYDSTSARWRGLLLPEPLGTFKDFGGALPAGFLARDGAAVSRTTYASLFNVIGTTFGVGDGSTTFNVPDSRGRDTIGAGTGTLAESVDSANVNTTNETFDVVSNVDTWVTGMKVQLTTTDTLPTNLSLATDYWVIRASATTIKFATSLANAQNGTAVNLASQGAGVHTLTHTLSARTLGVKGGEEAHAMSSTEQLAHGHSGSTTTAESVSTLNAASAGGSGVNFATDPTAGAVTVASTGGNAAMNVQSPYLVATPGIRYQ